MGVIFTESEAVEIAIQIEKNGKKYYEALTLSAQDAEAKEIYAYLRDEENKHQAIFEELLLNIEKLPPRESYPGEYQSYLRALAKANIFTDDALIEKMLRKATSPEEALQLSLGFEKDSILFFREIKELISEKDAPTINKVIDEEKKHLLKLTQLKKTFQND